MQVMTRKSLRAFGAWDKQTQAIRQEFAYSVATFELCSYSHGYEQAWPRLSSVLSGMGSPFEVWPALKTQLLNQTLKEE